MKTLALSVTLMLLANACGKDSPTGPDGPGGQRLEIVHVYGPWGLSQTGPQDLILVSVDGATSRPLLALSGSELSPEWSPNGKQILFARLGDDRAWIADEDGSNARPLTAIRGTSFRWSPDGQRIVYSRGNPSGVGLIVIARPDGSEERVVSPGAGPVSWSPDGRIAFRSFYEFGVWTIRTGGTQLTQLTTDPPDWFPRWSPDGSRLLVERWDGILVMDADGSNRRPLTDYDGAYWDGDASWSPDGQWILFTRRWRPGGESCALYRVPVGGGAPVVVVPRSPSTSCTGASWRR